MQTWTNADSSGANLIFKSGQELETYRPKTDSVSKFRPIPRPYPQDILALVPELLPAAMELAKTESAFTDQYRTRLLALAKPIVQKHNLSKVIVDTDRDLANATRQAVFTSGAIPIMEWWRHGSGTTDIGSWALSLDLASYWGMKSISIIDHTRDDPNYTDEQRNTAKAQTQGVFKKVFEQLSAAAKNDPRWSQYVKVWKQNNQGAGNPSRMGFMQVYLYEQNGKATQQPLHCLFLLNPQTLKSLEGQWNMPAGGVGGQIPENFLSGFACGNMLDENHGCMVTAYDQATMQAQQSQGAFGGSFGSGAKKESKTQYVATLTPEQALQDAHSRTIFRQWDDMLWIPTRAEAWMKCMEAMGEHPTAYAGRHEICLLPETIRPLAKQFADMEQSGAASGSSNLGFNSAAPPAMVIPGSAAPAGFAPPPLQPQPAAAGAPAMLEPPLVGGELIPAPAPSTDCQQMVAPAVGQNVALTLSAQAGAVGQPSPTVAEIPGAPVAPDFTMPDPTMNVEEVVGGIDAAIASMGTSLEAGHNPVGIAAPLPSPGDTTF